MTLVLLSPRYLRIVLPLAALACGAGDGGSVAPKTLVAVSVEATQATLRPGQSSQFTAKGVDAAGIEVPGAGAATWLSSATSVATVDGNGTVRAVAIGSTAIQATIRGIAGSRLITVLPAGAGAVFSMPGFSFAPSQVTINRTESVFFDFPPLPHNVIFQQRAGAPGDIQETANATIPRQFNAAGTFAFDCTLHPGMNGVVVVR